MEHQGPELWEEERAKVRDLVRDMNLYFPRLEYQERSPKEQVANQDNAFREETLHVLQLKDEPPLSSLGKQDLESYRLTWIGSSWRPPPFVVRVQRNRHGEVRLAITVNGKENGESVTQRRELREKDWAMLKKRLAAATYFELLIRVNETKPDRGWWIVEGWREGTYQYVEACSPGPGPYRELCEYFMGLGGLDPKLYERK